MEWMSISLNIGKRHRIADVERIGLKPLLAVLYSSTVPYLGEATNLDCGAASRVWRIDLIFTFVFSIVDDLSTKCKDGRERELLASATSTSAHWHRIV
ncbi:hypothetical protein Tco_0323949 [Tanacetum coccineum]